MQKREPGEKDPYAKEIKRVQALVESKRGKREELVKKKEGSKPIQEQIRSKSDRKARLGYQKKKHEERLWLLEAQLQKILEQQQRQQTIVGRMQKDYDNAAKELVQLCREAGQAVPEEEEEEWDETMGNDYWDHAGQEEESDGDGSESGEESEAGEEHQGGKDESKDKKRKTAETATVGSAILALGDGITGGSTSVKARAALLEKGTAQTRQDRSRTPVKN